LSPSSIAPHCCCAHSFTDSMVVFHSHYTRLDRLLFLSFI
jgi:hypothetical protein